MQLGKLISVKADWTLHGMYQDLYDKAKKIVIIDACMKFYNASRPLCLKTDVFYVTLGAKLLQVRNGMNCQHDEVPDNATLCPIVFASKTY